MDMEADFDLRIGGKCVVACSLSIIYFIVKRVDHFNIFLLCD